jgi:hypothetical protein
LFQRYSRITGNPEANFSIADHPQSTGVTIHGYI